MIRTLALLFGSVTVSMCGPAAQNNGPQDGKTVLAEVNGVPVTLEQFETQRPSALFQARNSFFDAEKKAVDEYLDDVLLDQQAAKEGLTVAQLLEKHVNGALPKDPDDASLRIYYEGIDTKEPFEAVRGKILDHLRDRRLAKAKAAYMDGLRTGSKLENKVMAPRVQISLRETPVRGPADAPLTFVEFSDYECPYCQQVQPVLEKLESEFKGKIVFAYKDMPLPMHARAQKAAEAARCAGIQGKYWDYHDLLLRTKNLELPQLKAGARDLGLDGKAFDKCVDSGEQAAAVASTLDEAQKLGLQGTPSFFLNGRFFNGVINFDQMRQIMQEELKRNTSPVEQRASR